MNWEALGAIGELIGALAVVTTLIFLILQLRQNTKALASQNTRNSLDSQTAILTSTMTSEIADILKRAYTDKGDLSDLELQIIDTYVYGYMSILHQDYLEYKEGLHSASWWRFRENGIRRLFWSETPRKIFAIYTHEDFDAGFMKLVEKLLSENPPKSYYHGVMRKDPP